MIAIAAALPGAPASPQPAATGPQRTPYALSIRAKHDEFRVGEEIRIEIVLKNISAQPLLAAPVIPTAETSYRAYVQDEKGNSAPETRLSRQLRSDKDEAGRETVTVFETGPVGYLQPGESTKEEIILGRLYDLSRPGKYTVRVQALRDVDGVAKSNPVSITVVGGTKTGGK